jgi:hypothetical protein
MTVADLQRELVRRFHVGKPRVEFREIDPAESDHDAVRDRDARQAVRIANRDALTKACERGLHGIRHTRRRRIR